MTDPSYTRLIYHRQGGSGLFRRQYNDHLAPDHQRHHKPE